LVPRKSYILKCHGPERRRHKINIPLEVGCNKVPKTTREFVPNINWLP